jgi:hypothetical protein
MKKSIETIKSNNKIIAIILVSLVVVFYIGLYFGKYIQKEAIKDYIASFQNLRDENRKFSYINPLLGVASAPATDIGLYTDIKSDISDYLAKEKANGDLYDFSFYFKDLTAPLWYGINEDRSFAPASLFKLPIAIIAYKQGEADPEFLTKQLVYTQAMKDANTKIQGNEDSALVVGKSYAVEDLIGIMLELSDNGAKDLLSTVIDQKYVTDLFRITSLINPSSAQSYEISSRKYALFLRLLYNGSYLKPRHSEYLLSLIAKSTFNDGIVDGVPSGTIVAHKFGVHDTTEIIKGVTMPASVLHDCGIVYYGESPYAICVMTKGKDVQTLIKIISHISKMVYEDVKEDR